MKFYIYFPELNAWGYLSYPIRFARTLVLDGFYVRRQFQAATPFDTESLAQEACNQLTFFSMLVVDQPTAEILSILVS